MVGPRGAEPTSSVANDPAGEELERERRRRLDRAEETNTHSLRERGREDRGVGGKAVFNRKLPVASVLTGRTLKLRSVPEKVMVTGL